jgi:hypothetical protein
MKNIPWWGWILIGGFVILPALGLTFTFLSGGFKPGASNE